MQNTSSYDSPVELEDDRWQDIDFTPYEGFASFISTPVFSTLLNVKNSVVFLVTGNRFGKCLTKDALVDTSNGKIPIYELYKANRPFMVWSWDGKNKVLAKADAPFKKDGTHDCYRITMSDNRVIEAADHHQILMQNGHYASVLFRLYRPGPNHRRIHSSFFKERSSGFHHLCDPFFSRNICILGEREEPLIAHPWKGWAICFGGVFDSFTRGKKKST